MSGLLTWNGERAAGLILILGTIVLTPGLIMFWQRRGHRRGEPRSRPHYVWERGFVLAGGVVATIGFVLLAAQAAGTVGRGLAIASGAGYLLAGCLVAAGEGLFISRDYKKGYAAIVMYVVLAFLAQATAGGALLQAGRLAAWIGWAAIVWNVAWLVVLPIVSRRDIYFPVLHHIMPLVIGIALLLARP